MCIRDSPRIDSPFTKIGEILLTKASSFVGFNLIKAALLKSIIFIFP